MATRLRSDGLVEQLVSPMMRDAERVHAATKQAVGFYSIAGWDEHNVPGSIDAYRRGVKALTAQSSGHIVLHSLNVGPAGMAAAIRQHDVRQSGLHGGVMPMIPLKDRSMEDEICGLVPAQMDIDGASGNGHYRAPTATAMRVMGEAGLQVASLRETKGRIRTAIIGAGRTAGGRLVEDLHRMDLDPIVITRENQGDRRFLRECGLIFSAVGMETITPLEVSLGAVVIDAGVRVVDPARPRETTFGDVHPDVYDMDGVSYTPVYHGVGTLTTAIATSNSVEAASRYNLLDITPRPLIPVQLQPVAA